MATNISIVKLFGVNILVNNPIPLHCFHPKIIPQSNLCLEGNLIKFLALARDDQRKRKRRNDEEASVPILPIEEIPRLLQTIESRNGSRPVFLYQKVLQETDVSKQHNRLCVCKNGKTKMLEFFTHEEFIAMNSGKKGVEIMGVDQWGNTYELHYKIWKSLKMMAVKSGWNKVVKVNGAEKGDWVQIWGYRENGKLCFGINFMKTR